MEASERLSLTEATDLIRSAFEAAGVPGETALSVARSLVAAEAEGQVGHGFSRVEDYLAQVRSGKIVADADIGILEIGTTSLLADAGFGFAYPALDKVIERGARHRPETRVLCHGHHPLPPLRRAVPSGGETGQKGTGCDHGHQCAGGHGALRGKGAGLRHQPDRLCRTANGWGTAGGRSVIVPGRPRQGHERPQGRTAHSRRLGAGPGRQPDHRCRGKRWKAPCCRSATQRARRLP